MSKRLFDISFKNIGKFIKDQFLTILQKLSSTIETPIPWESESKNLTTFKVNVIQL